MFPGRIPIAPLAVTNPVVVNLMGFFEIFRLTRITPELDSRHKGINIGTRLVCVGRPNQL